MIIEGKIVDVLNERIYPGELQIQDDRIVDIEEKKDVVDRYIIPGFVDSHIHIESTMLSPSEFSRIAVKHGTVATVSDPHEIANVLGLEGIRYMIDNGDKVPLKFYFGAPSCVPATDFETNGATLGPDKIEELFIEDDCRFLGEMMNYPGVINEEEDVMEKIKVSKKYDRPIDGHAPGLTGEDLDKYVSAGISTDHECISLEEAEEKIEKGMKIQIREGSLSKKLEDFFPLLEKYPDRCMLCSDDRHPDDLIRGHIDLIVKKALKKDIDLMDVLKVSSVNPIKHYGLDVGLLKKGDPADFIVVNDLDDLNIENVYINGDEVYDGESTQFDRITPDVINRFREEKIDESDIEVPYESGKIRVMDIEDGELVTTQFTTEPNIDDSSVISDTERDILKIIVLSRYSDEPPSIGFVHGFGFDKGAIAASISHDSHNIVAAGVDDGSICRAVNDVIKNRGGMSVISDEEGSSLPLPIAGLMYDGGYPEVVEKYTEIKDQVRDLGSDLTSPFMTLSFLTLLAIPEMKISDKGLFDVDDFDFVDLFVQ